jgi:hypothetical protein
LKKTFLYFHPSALCVGCSHIFLESELQSLTLFSKMLLEATLVGSLLFIDI